MVRRDSSAGFTIGTYTGGGVGLSTGGDAVNLFDASGKRVTGVSFGISTTGRDLRQHRRRRQRPRFRFRSSRH